MSILSPIRQFFTMQPAPVPMHEERAFVTGPATVDPAMTYWGNDNSDYQPPEYANYPATSNGVYACVSVRSRTLAGLPLRVYRVSATGDKTELTSGPLWLLLRKVNPYWTLSRLIDMTEQSMCTWGECFWFLAKKGRQPAEIWWARADKVKVHPHPTEYISHFTYEGVNGKPIRFERDETVWFRYANVADQYSGLSPLAAARLAADTASAAMHSNFNIFRNGVQMSGVLVPKSGTNLTEEQAREIADQMDRRFRGVDKAHRVGVLRYEIDVKTLSMTPKDAEFLGAMNWSLEDIARAFAVPIDKIGGKRTYQNVEESEKVFWHDCMLPEARFLAAEITEQLLPYFGDNLIAEFDTSDVDVLHEAETDRWTRHKEMIVTGYRTVNQLLKDEGLDPQPWGDVWWAPSTLIPIDSNEKPQPVMPAALMPGNDPNGNPQDTQQDQQPNDPNRSRQLRTIAYGSDEHRRLWDAFVTRTEPWERKVAAETKALLSSQRESVLAQLRNERKMRDIADFADDPFDQPRWIRRFREAIRPVLSVIASEAAQAAFDEVTITGAFNVQDPRILDAMMRQSQKFAEQVNQTTWDALRGTLRDGVAAGEDIDTLAGRVEDVMGERIRSSATTIARTETIRASTTGTHAGWEQSGVVSHVQWLSALDERTRPTHIEAHGQVVALGDDFQVGACSGPGPGEIDCAAESVNCRCTTIAILDVEIGSGLGA